MSIFNNNILAGAAAQSGTTTYAIDQSIRFNQADSAYLSKTFGASASNRRTHTYSFWVKLGANAAGTNSSGGCFFISTDDTGANAGDYFHLNGSLELRYWSNNSSAETFKTNQLFRDFSAWYHIVLVNDRDNATASEAVRLYVNGQRVTSFATDNISGRSGQDSMVNASSFYWQIQRFTSGNVHGDAYMAEIVFIDGQALDPTSFGETTSDGIWKPIDVSGLSFGTNGFHIKGETANDLGNDSSSNNNDFTTSGLAAHDQVSDSPTNNFCVISKINMGNATGVTLKNGNLEGTTSGTAGNMPASISLDSGKWYWEVNNHANGSGNNFGVGETPTGSFDQFTRGSNGNEVNTNAITTTGSSGQIIGFKLDFDAGTLTHTTDGTSYSSTGSLASNMAYAPHSRLGSTGGRVVFNFGQDSTFGGLETAGGNSDDNGIGNFQYSVPSGFLAICTKNLGAD